MLCFYCNVTKFLIFFITNVWGWIPKHIKASKAKGKGVIDWILLPFMTFLFMHKSTQRTQWILSTEGAEGSLIKLCLLRDTERGLNQGFHYIHYFIMIHFCFSQICERIWLLVEILSEWWTLIKLVNIKCFAYKITKTIFN